MKTGLLFHALLQILVLQMINSLTIFYDVKSIQFLLACKFIKREKLIDNSILLFFNIQFFSLQFQWVIQNFKL